MIYDISCLVNLHTKDEVKNKEYIFIRVRCSGIGIVICFYVLGQLTRASKISKPAVNS